MSIQIRTQLPGPKAQEIISLSRRYEPKCVTEQAPLVWQRAQGVWIEDVDGNRFLDFCSGVLVTNIGHCHPKYVAAVREQAGELFNCYDFAHPWRARLAQKLVELTAPNLDQTFILTTGAETIESALKVARRASGLVPRSLGEGGFEILAFEGAFHGRTYGAMSVGGNQAVKRGFGPLLPGVIHAPFCYCYRCAFNRTYPDCKLYCLEHLDWVVKSQSTGALCAVITESYQGAAGSIIPPPGYMEGLHQWAKQRKLVFILDEVQSSFGRTGKMFAYEHWNTAPDLLCLGKGLGSGVACSALVADGDLIGVLGPGEMSSTNGGNPLACRAACAAIEIIEEENLAHNAAVIGEKMLAAFKEMEAKFDSLGEARGMGLAIALEMVEDKKSKTPAPELAKRVVDECYQRGLALIAPIGLFGSVIRIAPPLVITENEAMTGVSILGHALKAVSAR